MNLMQFYGRLTGTHIQHGTLETNQKVKKKRGNCEKGWGFGSLLNFSVVVEYYVLVLSQKRKRQGSS